MRKSVLVQVTKWGKSLAVRLPTALVKDLGLKEGDQLKLIHAVRHKCRVSELLEAKVRSKLEILAEVRQLRNAMPLNFAFDRDEATVR